MILFTHVFSSADVIKLKNGRRLEGAIISQTKDAVVIDIGAGEAHISRKDIVSIEQGTEDNAAIYYLRAIGYATYIEPGELKKKVDLIAKNKWKADPKELDDILKENTRCLEEVEKGLAIKKCDFEFERKFRYLPEKKQKLDPKDVASLGRIFILKARSCEAQEKYGEAIGWYLSGVTFASQISQSEDPELKHVAVNLESDIYPLMKEYLDSVNVDKASCLRILDALALHEKELFPLKDYIQSDKEWYLDFFNSFESGVTLWYRENPQVEIKVRKKALNYAKELVKQAKELSGKYYDAFLKAAASGKDLDWKAANDECDKLIKDNKAAQALEDDIDQRSFLNENFSLSRFSDFEKRDPKTVSTVWLAYNLSSVKGGIDTYKIISRQISELKALAKLKSVTTYK